MIASRRSVLALPLAAFASPLSAMPGGGASVIELFTSQGCSSCPPADALLVRFAEEESMVALTYPVEIWDYLGWRDTLARPAFTKRQKAYAAAIAGKRVYTPQMVVNGAADCVGSDYSKIAGLRRSTRQANAPRLSLEATRAGWDARIAGDSPDARLIALPLRTRETVAIGKGENGGRSIVYANVVRDIIDLGPAQPGSVAVQKTLLEPTGSDGIAFLVQKGSIAAPGAVLAGAIATPGRIVS